MICLISKSMKGYLQPGFKMSVMEDFMATPLDEKRIVSFEELLLSQVGQSEALIKSVRGFHSFS